MRTNLVRSASLALLSLACAGGCSAPQADPPAVQFDVEADAEPAGFEGDAHGFPALRDLDGKTLADGEFTQWLDGERLHARIHYDFGGAHEVQESYVIRQEPLLVQEQWSWTETRDGIVQRRFAVDFLTGTATAEKLVEGEAKTWSEHVDLEPGTAFAGAAWALAIKRVRTRLLRGEKLKFQTVGFTPQPRGATVEISYSGACEVPLSGRVLQADQFRIHAKLLWIVKAFVDVPDSQIWLAHKPPAAFLRFEGPLAEPGDPLVRVDLMPGDASGPASPARAP